MELILIRHGIAEDAGPANQYRDALRSLTDEGVEKLTASARGLAELGLGPVEILLTSPLVRCAQTARILGDALGAAPRTDERLAPGMRLEQLVDVLLECPGAERIVVCGHQPDLSHVVLELTGGLAEFKKGAVCVVEVDRLEEAGGCILALYPPSALRRIGAP